MPAAADLTESSWKVFSALLDRALELAPSDRLAWLDTLDAEHEHLKPALRSLLQRSEGVETAHWLDTLPRSAGPVPALDESDLKAGALVGPYRLLRELGVGGMGSVWLAERADGTLKRQVALKLPRASWARGLAERMARERDILASLEHPNIARLYDAGTDAQGRPFLALEYVEGKPIDVYCRERALSIRQRLQLLLEVASAVTFAHSRLVVHRDLKPSNILVTAEGQVRLLDFGIAKLIVGDRTQETQLTRLAGQALTLDYASPEQIRGEPIGTASDVYSLAVVAFELLTGERPYRLKRGSAAETEEAIVAADVPLASQVVRDPVAQRALRGDLDAILNHALRKDAAQRYASVEAFAQDIERHLRDEPVLAQPDSAGYRLRKFVGRNRLPVGAATAVLVAIVFGAAIAFWQAREARQQAEQSEQVTRFVLDLVGSTDPDQGSRRGTTTVEMLLRAPARIQQQFSRQPEVEVRLLSAVGYSLLGLGETNASIPVLQAAIGTADRSLIADHSEALRARTRLGEALLAVDRLDEAQALLMQALVGLRAIDDVRGVIDALRWTSRLHSRRREADAAITAAEEAVHLARTRLPPNQLQSALNAEIEYLTALQIARRRGQLEPARRAHELTEALYPDKVVRPKLTAREGYGTALLAEGDAVEGVRLLNSALEDAKELFGPNDRMLGYFAGRLMGGQLRIGDVSGALDSARFARKTWDSVHRDKPHSDLAYGRMYEGSMLSALQRFDEAAPLLGEAASLFAQIQGSGSRVAAIARAGQAIALAQNGDFAGAEKAFGALPTKLDTFEDVAVTARFGLIRHLQRRSEEAAGHLRTALAKLQTLGGERFELAAQQVWLASALTDLGRVEEAKSLLDSALKTYVATQPNSSPAQAEAWEILARVEMALGNARQAVDAAAKSVAFWQSFAPAAAAAVRALLIQAQAQQQAGESQAAAETVRRARLGAAVLKLDSDIALLARSTEVPR